jgi:hypothetical protein
VIIRIMANPVEALGYARHEVRPKLFGHHVGQDEALTDGVDVQPQRREL